MTRDDQVLSLLADANPVSDPSRFVVDTKTRARLETIEQGSGTMADTEIRSIEPPKSGKTRRGWLIAVAAAAVVIVAGVGTWFVTNQESDDATVAPGEAVQPTVTFTGTECIYEGPREFVLGEERWFLFKNQSDDLRLQTRISIGDSMTGTRFSRAVAPGDEFLQRGSPGPPVPDVAGTWSIGCESPFNSTPEFGYHAGIFRVVAG